MLDIISVIRVFIPTVRNYIKDIHIETLQITITAKTGEIIVIDKAMLDKLLAENLGEGFVK